MRVGYFYADNILTPEECDLIIREGGKELHPALVGTVDGGKLPDPEIRKGQTAFFCSGENPEIDELMHRCVRAMSECSMQAYGVSIAQVEPIQFTDYLAGDHYRWHYDQHGIGVEEKPERFVSASIELSDPDSYEGGGLEFFGISDAVPDRKRGRIIVFSSMMCHRARIVESGRRCSLVLWGRP